VKVSDLHRVFFHQEKQLHVLRGVEMTLLRGEMIAVVGESGVGKSTLLQVVGTLDRPTSGGIQFEGVDVFDLDERSLAEFRNRSIGFVFQFHHLLPEFTALENTVMPALIARHDRSQAIRRGEHLLEEVGLTDRMSHRPGELSGGEQQRVALARALAMEPALVLADEPTGNLDEGTSEEIHDLIVRLNEQTKTTFLVVTHNQSLATRMSRTVQLVDGVVREVEATA